MLASVKEIKKKKEVNRKPIKKTKEIRKKIERKEVPITHLAKVKTAARFGYGFHQRKWIN